MQDCYSETAIYPKKGILLLPFLGLPLPLYCLITAFPWPSTAVLLPYHCLSLTFHCLSKFLNEFLIHSKVSSGMNQKSLFDRVSGD